MKITEVPTCHDRPMTRKESYVTGHVFYRCDVCRKNTYSQVALVTARTVKGAAA
jgi:transposase-like protein